MASSGKKTRGRQKIEMKKIENEDDRLITFSKRRSGIYKKASELSILCGAEVGFLCFSPAGKPFSFGDPSIESVAIRFLNQNLTLDDNTHPLVEAHRTVRINKLNQHLNEVTDRMDAEKEKEKVLLQLTGGKQTPGWWEAPTDQLNLEELEDLHSRFDQLRNRLYSTMNKKTGVGASTSVLAPMDPAQLTNPFATNPNVDVAAAFPPPGFGPSHQQS